MLLCFIALHIVTNIYTIFCHPIPNQEYKIKFPGNIGEGETLCSIVQKEI